MKSIIKVLLVYEVQVNASHSYSREAGGPQRWSQWLPCPLYVDFFLNFLVGTFKPLAKYCVFQLSLEILLPQPPKCWNYRPVLLYMVKHFVKSR